VEAQVLSGKLGVEVGTYWIQLKEILREGFDERISFELADEGPTLSWSKLLDQDISILHGQIPISLVSTFYIFRTVNPISRVLT
jgi:hypothetical protein